MQEDAPTSQTHRVESAEWLARLSRTYYGTLYCWPVIWEANREILDSPDRVQPGTVLTITPASQCKYDGM
jgi:nucleoid-associated protein YgaU